MYFLAVYRLRWYTRRSSTSRCQQGWGEKNKLFSS